MVDGKLKTYRLHKLTKFSSKAYQTSGGQNLVISKL